MSEPLIRTRVILANFKSVYLYDTVLEKLCVFLEQPVSKTDGSFHKIHLVRALLNGYLIMVDDEAVKLICFKSGETI